jgi:hypothetical protein
MLEISNIDLCHNQHNVENLGHKGSIDSVSVADGKFDDSEPYADVLLVSSCNNSLIDS